jgi:hypothetical protein
MATRVDVGIVEVPVAYPRTSAAWPVYWSAVFVGALSAIAIMTVIGLLSVAFGAYDVGAGGRFGPQALGVGDLVAAVCGAFFSSVAGGWIASRIAGLRTAEPAMLHGGVVWLVALPLILLLVALGAGGLFGAWYAGLGGTPAWATPPPPGPRAAQLAREAAGGAATALLIGLVGAVIGGWLGSGESMHPMHYRTRRTVP